MRLEPSGKLGFEAIGYYSLMFHVCMHPSLRTSAILGMDVVTIPYLLVIPVNCADLKIEPAFIAFLPRHLVIMLWLRVQHKKYCTTEEQEG